MYGICLLLTYAYINFGILIFVYVYKSCIYGIYKTLRIHLRIYNTSSYACIYG